MIVSDVFWQKIKDQFTEDKILLLTAAASGHSICPRGVLLDDAKLESKLAVKLLNLKGANHGNSTEYRKSSIS